MFETKLHSILDSQRHQLNQLEQKVKTKQKLIHHYTQQLHHYGLSNYWGLINLVHDLNWTLIHPPPPYQFNSLIQQPPPPPQQQINSSDLAFVIDPVIYFHPTNFDSFTIALGLGLLDSSTQPLINVSLSLHLLTGSSSNIRISFTSQIIHQLNPGKWMTISCHGHCSGLMPFNQQTQPLMISGLLHFNNRTTLPIPGSLKLNFVHSKYNQPDPSMPFGGLHIQFPHKLSCKLSSANISPNITSPSAILQWLDPIGLMQQINAGITHNTIHCDDLPIESIHAVDFKLGLSMTIIVHLANTLPTYSILITGMNMYDVVDRIHQIYRLVLHHDSLAELTLDVHSYSQSISHFRVRPTLHSISSMYKHASQMIFNSPLITPQHTS